MGPTAEPAPTLSPLLTPVLEQDVYLDSLSSRHRGLSALCGFMLCPSRFSSPSGSVEDLWGK